MPSRPVTLPSDGACGDGKAWRWGWEGMELGLCGIPLTPCSHKVNQNSWLTKWWRGFALVWRWKPNLWVSEGPEGTHHDHGLPVSWWLGGNLEAEAHVLHTRCRRQALSHLSMTGVTCPPGPNSAREAAHGPPGGAREGARLDILAQGPFLHCQT